MDNIRKYLPLQRDRFHPCSRNKNVLGNRKRHETQWTLKYLKPFGIRSNSFGGHVYNKFYSLRSLSYKLVVIIIQCIPCT